MTAKENVFLSAISTDTTYLGCGSWADLPPIICEECLSIYTVNQETDGKMQTVRFTDRQLERFYKMLKRKFEE